MDTGEFWDPRRRRIAPTLLGDILTPGLIKVPLVGSDSSQVVRELVDLLIGAGEIYDGDSVFDAIISRERVRSTGVGSGLAIPHARTPQVGKLTMALGTCPDPIDFDGIDGVGVRIVVMLLSPLEMPAQCIGVMNRIIAEMSQAALRDQLLSAGSAVALHETLGRFESPTR
jgi:mannitol/fructose-specific phosphotransferase system IIA component (Ntr-type)